MHLQTPGTDGHIKHGTRRLEHAPRLDPGRERSGVRERRCFPLLSRHRSWTYDIWYVGYLARLTYARMPAVQPSKARTGCVVLSLRASACSHTTAASPFSELGPRKSGSSLAPLPTLTGFGSVPTTLPKLVKRLQTDFLKNSDDIAYTNVDIINDSMFVASASQSAVDAKKARGLRWGLGFRLALCVRDPRRSEGSGFEVRRSGTV